MSQELNPQDRAALDAVLTKPVNELTDADKALLRARRSYLTLAEREKYGLSDDKSDETVTGDEEIAQDEQTASEGISDTSETKNASEGQSEGAERSSDDDQPEGPVNYAELPRQELVALAKARGVKANGKSDEIIARLEAQDVGQGADE